MTSSESAARFREMYESRGAHLQRLMRDTAYVAAQFREVVLSKIGRLTPKFPAQILQEVDDDWGCTNIRRIHNALTRLIKDGKIKRTPEGYLLVRVRR